MKRMTLQKLRDINPIEDLFFKRRTLFGIDIESYDEQPVENVEYIVYSYSGHIDQAQLDDTELKCLYQKIGESRVDNRLERDDCSLFLARKKDKQNSDVAGFYWSVAPNGDVVWHDKLKVDDSEALVFNGFVSSKHRRNGVYRLLQGAIHNHLFYEKDVDIVYTIVENRNTASMSANEKFGLENVAINYLIKLLSINLFSVFYNRSRFTIYLVLNKDSL